MLSKEEIEKAKERLKKKVEDEKILGMLAHIDKIVDENILINKSIETLLQYIYQLEQENKKLNKMIDEMAEQLAGLTILDIEEDEYIVLGDKDEVRQYFEKKVEEKE